MNKMSRREKREAMFLLLYQMLLNDDTLDEIIQADIEAFELTADVGVSAAVQAVIEYSDKADEVINKYSKTRKVERIAKIPLSILRLGVFEMDCVPEDEIPDKVAINEAIELCKKYAGVQDSKFVSGLLGSHYRDKHGTTDT
jgi:N utilization substance protein B